MGRTKNSLNVTEAERGRIRQLYRAGVRIVDIVRRTGRSESVVSRAVRGLSRPRPRPKSRVRRRNELIIRRVVEDGLSQTAVARRFGLTPTSVCQIVREAIGLRAMRHPPAPLPTMGVERGPSRAKSKLPRAQATRRNSEIHRLVVLEGVGVSAVARRFDLSPAQVRRIVEARLDLG